MKHRHSLIIILFSGILLSGCLVTSMHPVFSPETEVFLPELLGVWAQGDEMEVTFQRDGDKDSYLMTMRMPAFQIDGTYEAHLAKLDENLYLDYAPVIECEKLDLMGFAALYRTHMISRLALASDGLRINGISFDWFKSRLSTDEIDVSFVKEVQIDEAGNDQGRLLLSGTTEELQEFLIRHSGDESLFPDDGKRFQRQ